MMTSGALAWIPFVEPLNALQDIWYLLLLPLSFGLAMIYKAMRVPDLSRYWREVALMTVQIMLGMIGLAIALVILVQLLIPAIPAE
jgi:hypothetical protein